MGMPCTFTDVSWTSSVLWTQTHNIWNILFLAPVKCTMFRPTSTWPSLIANGSKHRTFHNAPKYVDFLKNNAHVVSSQQCCNYTTLLFTNVSFETRLTSHFTVNLPYCNTPSILGWVIRKLGLLWTCGFPTCWGPLGLANTRGSLTLSGSCSRSTENI